MAPPSFRRLIAAQHMRLDEIARLSAGAAEISRDSMHKGQIKARIKDLKAIREEARKTHTDIMSRDEAVNDSYCKEDIFAKIQMSYEKTLDQLIILIAGLDDGEGSSRVSRASRSRSADSDCLPAKLSKLDLPSFSGNYEDWESFSDLFNNMVHDIPRVADSTKLKYLKLCLKGSAAEYIKDITITDANYASAWRALKHRFFKPRSVMNQHFDRLMNLPALKCESSTGLRKLSDDVHRIVHSLKNLGAPVEYWDLWLIHLIRSRLDPESRKQWEAELSLRDSQCQDATVLDDENRDFVSCTPKFIEMTKFIERRVQTLSESGQETTIIIKRTPIINKPGMIPRRVFHDSFDRNKQSDAACPECKGAHTLANCRKFQRKGVADRKADIRRLRLCYNCFGNHRVDSCPVTLRCTRCNGKHHTLIHTKAGLKSDAIAGPSKVSKPDDQPMKSKGVLNVHSTLTGRPRNCVIFATARARLLGSNGAQTEVRIMFDQAAEASFITESITQLLGLSKNPIDIPLTGLGGTPTGNAKSSVEVAIQSLVEPGFELTVELLVRPRLTNRLPSRNLPDLDLSLFEGLQLADPTFYESGKIDVVIGLDLYSYFMRCSFKHLPPTELMAQDGPLGWIIFGSTVTNPPRRADTGSFESINVMHCATDNLQASLEKFWAIEEITSPCVQLKPEERACEELFANTHRRDDSGRYVVRLPLKAKLPEESRETRGQALGSLTSMQRRFRTDPELRSAYSDFMRSYEQLGHMSRVPAGEIDNSRAWYLPHHAVMKRLDTGIKLRVVFDASRKMRAGHCLNDFLMVGPPLQRDLSLILLNWRRYRYVFTADIVKMFRQILVDSADQDCQRIVWAGSTEEAPVEYQLTTVTYGTACAPYLAIRTLDQLAKDGQEEFPLGSRCLMLNTYVDDIFAGSNDLDQAIRKRDQVMGLLRSAGIALGKWASNEPRLIPPESLTEGFGKDKNITENDSIKTLGIFWNPDHDDFRFRLEFNDNSKTVITKRGILSQIAKLFDPLGWLASVTVIAKIILQNLWILHSDWDSAVPMDMRNRWLEYGEALKDLPQISIPRWMDSNFKNSVQIHGFSDASKRAYAAVVYLRTISDSGDVNTVLLSAKSKVAPVRTVSIPNLELCGAVLLVRLVIHLRKLDILKDVSVFLWTDSQIVLAWLRKHPSSWKTFVANRVSIIQSELSDAKWGYVATNENPADLATRGVKPIELVDNKLWWRGPVWLRSDPGGWKLALNEVAILHTRTTKKRKKTKEPKVLRRFSSLTMLIRVIASCFRFVAILRKRISGEGRNTEFLTYSQLKRAKYVIIRMAQRVAYPIELKQLRKGGTLSSRHPLLSLNPVYDRELDLLRVGGRLRNSDLQEDHKHPPILPKNFNVSKLFVRHAHCLCLHGGPTLTSSVLNQQVWIVGQRVMIKSAIHKCVLCQRIKPKSVIQLMGDLPKVRVTPSRPFTNTGLDYAGPFNVKSAKGRGIRSSKGYIALFVCLSSRAIHLEMVSDLTTGTFLAAFRRFIGRRGKCRILLSDNASTFRGADTKLKSMFSAASAFYGELAAQLENDGTSWTFIPPTTPHYGGIWEAGVKAVKHHLRRIMGDRMLTYEEFSTLLVEIEVCLNSRPICPMSNSIEDLDALTPAHLLIGETPILVPDEERDGVPENRLNQHQLLQRLRNQFWRKWSNDYLHHLQERSKWRTPVVNFQAGQMVLIHDDRLPPSKWQMGRVLEVYPGADELVRVVKVKTATGEYKRHVARLSPIYIDEEKD